MEPFNIHTSHGYICTFYIDTSKIELYSVFTVLSFTLRQFTSAREHSFYCIVTVKVFPLECSAIYGIYMCTYVFSMVPVTHVYICDI